MTHSISAPAPICTARWRSVACPPTIANGKLFLATSRSAVLVYGLR